MEIWKGDLSWKNPKSDSNQEQAVHSVVCTVTSSLNEAQEPIVRSENWPQKLIMQLIPKSLVQQIGGTSSKYFNHAPSVLFHLSDGPSKEALTKVLTQGYAGCVHFQSDKDKKCDIKVLILLYSPDKNTYLGFIPNEQLQFVDCIRKVIQQQKEQQRAAVNIGNMQQQQGGMVAQGQLQVTNPMGMQGGTMSMAPNGTSFFESFVFS